MTHALSVRTRTCSLGPAGIAQEHDAFAGCVSARLKTRLDSDLGGATCALPDLL